jgi:hypothetical protein
MNKLIKDFYKVVDCMINEITDNDNISNKLFKCRYDTYYQKTKKLVSDDNGRYTLIFCLGGMAYYIYYEIISRYYQNIKLESTTEDYDFSFCLSTNTNDDIEIIKNTIKDIYDKCIKNYQFQFEDEYRKKYKLNKSNFSIEFENKKDRLQIKINCKYGSRNFHILELCFWFDGKISDNFTINDFKKEKLFIYVDNDGYSYYLLPLEKLIKTTYYAMLDNYERDNFIKCNKYLDRIRYIKLTNDEYNDSDKKIELLNFIFSKYLKYIYRKYKIMYDYPFINSKILVNEKNKEIVKCVHRELRTNTHKVYLENIKNYMNKCKNKENLLKYNEITDEDTENDLVKNDK